MTTPHLLPLHCPECGALSLHARVVGQAWCLAVELVSQSCECDPFHAWEDVWEEAREMVLEQERVD
jgi:hypothetical protein